MVIYDHEQGSSSASSSQPICHDWLLSNDPAVCCLNEALKCKLRSLFTRAIDVSIELKHDEIQPKKMEVDQWLTDVRRIRDEVQNLATDGKSIQKFTSQVDELLQRGNFPQGCVLPDDSPIELLLPAKNPAGENFASNAATILEWLKNNERCIIGVYGMGGVGKTTLLTWLYNEVLKKKSTFGRPYWVTVSQNCDELKLQNEIAKELGVDLSGEGDDRKRASILYERLSTMGPTVLFLDDMWKWNPFLGMDIEFPIEGSSCKIILSSRLSKVCREMGCKDFVIKAKVLPEGEAWNLFVDKLGHYDKLPEEAKEIARLIAIQCGGLPLAIATTARSMTEVVDVRVWKDALNELSQYARKQGNIEDYVFSVLKYSYNRLNDWMLQNCFLSCILYPEDYPIKRKELIDGWIIKGLLDDVGSRSKQLNKGHAILNRLINSCLLEACTDYDGCECVKMHDLMRDLAIMITTRYPCFMTKSGLKLQEVPEEEQWSKDLVKDGSKCLKSKKNGQPKLKGIKGSRRKTKVFEVEPSQFRSTVQRLTGKVMTREIYVESDQVESDQVFFEIFKISKAYDDMLCCMGSYKKLECSVNVSQECIDCLVFCSLFPKDYEIDRDTLLQLWMAEGLIREEPMEDIAISYLKALCKQGECISLLREDEGTGKMWYKVNSFEIPEQVLQISKISPLRLISEDPTSVLTVAETGCVHVTLQRLLPKDFQALGRYSKIRTLLLLGKHKGNVESVPYDFFMSLQHLRALDLSRTKVSELPSSIGNARCLRYLDLSETLIKRLPETIEFLRNLQTLKLQNCPCLVALPKSTKKLTCLRHLDLGTLRRMRSMPAGMGALSCLRTLSEFTAGKEHGCRITELRYMNDLGGKFCLSKLENVASPDEATEANLGYKKRLKYLELRWTDDEHQESIGVEYEVMKCLQPHTNIQDLRILCYEGSTFPSWISHPSFDKLTKVTIFKCASCQVLPSLGQLPSLESLSLIELIGVRIIDNHFRRDMLIAAADNNGQFVAFPALQKLEINSMLYLEKWSDIEKVDFPRLRKFSIKKCPKLVALCEVTNIRALEYLELNQCTKLTSLPDGELPAALETVVIENCPRFNFSFSMGEKQDWVKSQHSPNSSIYQREAEKGRKSEEGSSSSIASSYSSCLV